VVRRGDCADRYSTDRFAAYKSTSCALYSVEEIGNALGESVRFQQKRERHYIDEREKDDLMNDLMDSFIKRTLHYLSLPDFPGKYILKGFQTYRKRKTWYQNV